MRPPSAVRTCVAALRAPPTVAFCAESRTWLAAKTAPGLPLAMRTVWICGHNTAIAGSDWQAPGGSANQGHPGLGWNRGLPRPLSRPRPEQRLGVFDLPVPAAPAATPPRQGQEDGTVLRVRSVKPGWRLHDPGAGDGDGMLGIPRLQRIESGEFAVVIDRYALVLAGRIAV